MTAKLGRLAKQVPMYKLTDPTSYEFTWARMLGGARNQSLPRISEDTMGGNLNWGVWGRRRREQNRGRSGPRRKGDRQIGDGLLRQWKSGVAGLCRIIVDARAFRLYWSIVTYLFLLPISCIVNLDVLVRHDLWKFKRTRTLCYMFCAVNDCYFKGASKNEPSHIDCDYFSFVLPRICWLRGVPPPVMFPLYWCCRFTWRKINVFIIIIYICLLTLNIFKQS